MRYQAASDICAVTYLLVASTLLASPTLANEGETDGPSGYINPITNITHLEWGDEEALCRCRLDYLPPLLFAEHACALCYKYHPTFHVGNKADQWRQVPVVVTSGTKTYKVLKLFNGTQLFAADAEQPDPGLLETFPSARDVATWTDCCRSAVHCCRRMRTAPSPEAGWCPPTWDGWQCWDGSPPERMALARCPSYVYAKSTPSCDRYASKLCEVGGVWFTSVDQLNQTQEMSNYSSCSSVPTHLKRIYVHVSAYAISIVALVPALVIFFSYKQLKVHRISIHKHFFLSLLLNSVMVILFKCVVMLDELGHPGRSSIIAQNGVGCKALFIMTKYCRLTNYLWQFCESYYLHKLIASAFAEQRSLLVFYIIGWAFPVVPVSVYAVLRAYTADGQCWVVPVEMYEWVLNAPCLLSLVMCSLFLVNIIRVLVTKLRAADNLRVGEHANEPSQYRRAVRATLILVPLFGLHLMVTMYRPTRGSCTWMEAYYYADYLLDGLQGAMVALIFCYLNGEVQNLLRRTYGRCGDVRGPIFRGEHRSSSLTSRSQHTMHTMVGPEPSSTMAVLEPGTSNAPLIRQLAAEKECRL